MGVPGGLREQKARRVHAELAEDNYAEGAKLGNRDFIIRTFFLLKLLI